MARFSLVPKDRVFFDLFAEGGQNTLRTAKLLRDLLQRWPDEEGLSRDILKAEQEGDRITHDIVQRLNTTFVTPIDREDIYALATQLDDIVDHIEEVADFMGLYRIEAPMDQAQALAEVLVKSCEQLYGLLQHLRGFKDLDHYWIEIHRLENDGDRIYRDAVASLFADRIDPMVVIRWRDIFLRLERAIDATETVRLHRRGHRHQERVSDDVVIVIVVATALLFDFTNGFHDTANVVATSISTHAMPPRIAVAYAAIFNFVGRLHLAGGGGDGRKGRG